MSKRAGAVALGVFVMGAANAACDGDIQLGSSAGAIPVLAAEAGTDSAGGSDGPTSEHPFGSCAVGGDCVLATLHCDVARGACVECRTETDCLSGDRKHCETSLSRCVSCRTDDECESGKRCDSATRRCVDRCSTTRPCSEGTCDLATGICAECSPGTCLDQRVCTTTAVCVECTSDSDCAAAGEEPFCDRLLARCVKCTSLRQCASGLRCDPASGECRTATSE